MQRLNPQRPGVDLSQKWCRKRSEDGRGAEARRSSQRCSSCTAFARASVQAVGCDDRAGVRGGGHEMDPSRVTRTAQSLEGDGFIRRERDVRDNRVMRMYLTEDGREVLRRLPEINEQLRRRVHSVLSEEEFEELRR